MESGTDTMAAWCRKIWGKGGVVIANGVVPTRSLCALPVITDKDENVLAAAQAARGKCEGFSTLLVMRGEREGFVSLENGMKAASPVWKKPEGEAYPHNHDTMLLYFTSGTERYDATARWHNGTCAFAIDRPTSDDPVPDLGVVTCRAAGRGAGKP